MTVAALLGAAAGGVTLDDEQFGAGGVSFGAVGQFAGQGEALQGALAHDEFARFAGGVAGAGGGEAAFNDALGFARVFFQERGKGVGGDGSDNAGNFRTAQQLMGDMGWTLLDVIWYERRAELAMEGDRWFDLVRSGRANKGLFAGDPIRESNFDDNDLWLPIALEELAVAPNLTEYPDASLFQ